MWEGVLLVAISGVCLGLFLAPLDKLQGWRWENFWIVWSVFALLLGPIAVAAESVPNLFEVYAALNDSTLLMTVVVGMIAGVSGFLYGRAVPIIGLGLATALNNGSSVASGSLIPLVAIHSSNMLHASGLLSIVGVSMTIIAVSICARAGAVQHRQMNDPGTTSLHHRNPLTYYQGVGLCITAGLLTSGLNLGLAFQDRISESARNLGVSNFGVANAFIAPYLVGGFISNFLYALAISLKNRTFFRFFNPGSPSSFLWSMLMGIIFIAGISFYASGVAKLGSFGVVVGWGISTGCTIVASNCWDFLKKKWHPRPMRLMLSGLGLLLISMLLLASSQVLHGKPKQEVPKKREQNMTEGDFLGQATVLPVRESRISDASWCRLQQGYNPMIPFN